MAKRLKCPTCGDLLEQTRGVPRLCRRCACHVWAFRQMFDSLLRHSDGSVSADEMFARAIIYSASPLTDQQVALYDTACRELAGIRSRRNMADGQRLQREHDAIARLTGSARRTSHTGVA